MLRLPDQPLATRVGMQIIQLGPPEWFGLQLHRMPARLPETPLAIRTPPLLEHLAKRTRQVLRGKVRQLSAGKLTKVVQRLLHRFDREALMEEDAVHVGGHDDIGIDAQALVPMTLGQAFRDDLTSLCRDKDGQPVDDGERDVEDGAVGMKTIAFHGRSIAG